jgi:hypothetical protein
MSETRFHVVEQMYNKMVQDVNLAIDPASAADILTVMDQMADAFGYHWRRGENKWWYLSPKKNEVTE